MMRLLIWARLRVNFACTSLGILVDYSLVKVTTCIGTLPGKCLHACARKGL